MKKGKLIHVETLAEHGRKLFELLPREAEADDIAARELLLFAMSSPVGGLRPIVFTGSGSMGVIWYDEQQVYSYRETLVSGSLNLTEWSAPEQGRLKGKAALWEIIEKGLKHRKLWEEAKAIEDPNRRAKAIASFYVKASRPAGDFKGAAMDEQLVKMGRKAVPAIAEVLEELAPDEEVDKIAGVLLQIIRPHEEDECAEILQPVVPPLVKWLETCDKSNPELALKLLKHAADPRAVKPARRMLKHEKPGVRCMASAVLGATGDIESFDAIAGLLLKSEEGSSHDFHLRQALTTLDPEGAKTIIERLRGR